MDSARLLDTFLDIVRIDSPSCHEGAVARYCAKALEEAGCSIRFDDSAARTGSDTGNLIATLPGTAPGKVFITGHMDNVDPCCGVKPLVRDGVVYSDGTTVLGCDDKVAPAAAIETVRCLKEDSKPYPTVVVLLTVQEEVGLVGAHNVDDNLFDGEPVFVCDGDLAPGTVTVASAYQYAFEIAFHGRAAHAGVSPELGISAVEMAAAAISGMELGRIDDTTTANVARIEGGAATNIVAAECSILGECRAMTLERLDEVRAQIEESVHLATETFGGTSSSTWTHSVEGYSFDEDDPYLLKVFEAARSVGLEPAADVSCGATDGNCFALHGARPLVLGTGMTDFHSTREHIAVADIEGLVRHLQACCYVFAG